MGASALAVHCAGVDYAEAGNSVVGVSGHAEVGDKDDGNAAVTQSTGRYRKVPPEVGSGITRAVAMLQEVVRCASRLLDIVANDSDEEADQAIVEDGAVDKVGED